MDIPVVTELAIEEFSGGKITIPVSMTTNVVYGKRPSGKVFATQRPSINIFEDASETVTDTLGRGIYYWNSVDARYIVNGDTVYKNDYSAPLAATLTSGTERVEIFEVGGYLVILDTENNEGWTIAEGASTTLVAISDLDFPPNQTPALTLAKGGAELNGKLYVYCTNGEIFESDVEDPTSYNILNFINSEVRADGGVCLFKHSDHLAAVGNRSLEFFYDNANPTGSTLNARQDVVHDIGTIAQNTYFGDANVSYFVGITESGDVSVYVLQNFAITKISNNDLDSFLTSAIITDGVKIVGSGFSAGGRGFYTITLYNVNSSVVNPLTSLVFDASTQFWNIWELAHDGISNLPLIDWTRSTGTRAGNGILYNGDIVTVLDDFHPQDSIEAQIYVLADYVEPGYISDTQATGNNIPIQIITGAGSFGTQDDKFMSRIRIKGTPTNDTELMFVQWSDEGNDNYNNQVLIEPAKWASDDIRRWADGTIVQYNINEISRAIDLSNPKNKLNRAGKFKTRNFKISGAFSEQVEIEGLQVEINV